MESLKSFKYASPEARQGPRVCALPFRRENLGPVAQCPVASHILSSQGLSGERPLLFLFFPVTGRLFMSPESKGMEFVLKMWGHLQAEGLSSGRGALTFWGPWKSSRYSLLINVQMSWCSRGPQTSQCSFPGSLDLTPSEVALEPPNIL